MSSNRENTVFLYGMVFRNQIQQSRETGEITGCRLMLNTVRRTKSGDNYILEGRVVEDLITVVTRNVEFVKEHMMDLEKGDFVTVKGTFSVMEVTKHRRCTNCGHINSRDGVMIYVDPQYIHRDIVPGNDVIKKFRNAVDARISFLSAEAKDKEKEREETRGLVSALRADRRDAVENGSISQEVGKQLFSILQQIATYSRNLGDGEPVDRYLKEFQTADTQIASITDNILLEHCEVSNLVHMFGTLCSDVTYYQDKDTHHETCEFHLASNRIRRIIEDGPDKRTDYPVVRCFGRSCSEYRDALHINSTIYINGAIQARQGMSSTSVCEECGEEFTTEIATMEIVPYHIEYIDDCIIPESTRHPNEP